MKKIVEGVVEYTPVDSNTYGVEYDELLNGENADEILELHTYQNKRIRITVEVLEDE